MFFPQPVSLGSELAAYLLLFKTKTMATGSGVACCAIQGVVWRWEGGDEVRVKRRADGEEGCWKKEGTLTEKTGELLMRVSRPAQTANARTSTQKVKLYTFIPA